jgi:4-hydroxybenzoate polyprenyltransferase
MENKDFKVRYMINDLKDEKIDMIDEKSVLKKEEKEIS